MDTDTQAQNTGESSGREYDALLYDGLLAFWMKVQQETGADCTAMVAATRALLHNPDQTAQWKREAFRAVTRTGNQEADLAQDTLSFAFHMLLPYATEAVATIETDQRRPLGKNTTLLQFNDYKQPAHAVCKIVGILSDDDQKRSIGIARYERSGQFALLLPEALLYAQDLYLKDNGYWPIAGNGLAPDEAEGRECAVATVNTMKTWLAPYLDIEEGQQIMHVYVDLDVLIRKFGHTQLSLGEVMIVLRKYAQNVDLEEAVDRTLGISCFRMRSAYDLRFNPPSWEHCLFLYVIQHPEGDRYLLLRSLVDVYGKKQVRCMAGKVANGIFGEGAQIFGYTTWQDQDNPRMTQHLMSARTRDMLTALLEPMEADEASRLFQDYFAHGDLPHAELA